MARVKAVGDNGERAHLTALDAPNAFIGKIKSPKTTFKSIVTVPATFDFLKKGEIIKEKAMSDSPNK